MENIKKNYIKAIQKLNFSQFNILVKALKVVRNNHGRYIASQYYLLLTKNLFCNQFIKQLFKTFEDN